MFKSNIKLLALVIVLILTLSTVVLADSSNNSRVILVSGTGNILVKPDSARLNFRVISNDKDQKVALNDNNLRMEKLIQSFKDYGIKEEDIATESVYLNPIYNYENNSSKIASYQAINSVSLELKDLSKIGNLMSYGIRNGADSLDYIDYKSSKADELYNKALQMAIKESKIKANAIAEALGVEIKQVLRAEESSTNYFRNNTVSLDSVKEESMEDVPMKIEDLSIIANVRVEFGY